MTRRISGLALATALTAGVLGLTGTSSARASLLCSEVGVLTECPAFKEWVPPAATGASLVNSELRAGFANFNCNNGFFNGKLTVVGGGVGVPVEGEITESEMFGCGMEPVGASLPWGYEMIGNGNRDGTMTIFGVKFVAIKLGVTCTYRGKEVEGVFNGGAPATLEISTNLEKVAGGILCANPAPWTAKWSFTAPNAAFLTAK